MTTVVLVHGTGVRADRFDALHELFARRLFVTEPALSVVPCFWGGSLGIPRDAGDDALPLPDRERAIDSDVAGTEPELVTWAALEIDPFAELNAVAATSGGRRDRPPGGVVASPASVAVGNLYAPDVSASMAALGLGHAFADAVEVFAAADELVLLAADWTAATMDIVARAVVAQTLAFADAQLGFPFPVVAAQRAELVSLARIHRPA
jgi:hypothetical protein